MHLLPFSKHTTQPNMEPQQHHHHQQRTLRSLISKLSSVSDQTRTTALCELRNLTKLDPQTRPVIANQDGAISFLSDILYSSDPIPQQNAAATLLNLSISCPDSLISTRGLLDALSHALSNHRHYHPSAVQSASATVYSLCTVEQYRPIVGSKRDLVYAMIDILIEPSSSSRSVKDALRALFALALYPLNRGTMVELGVSKAVFGMVVRGWPVGLVEDATAVIAQVAGCEEAVEGFRVVKGIRVLVDLLDPCTGWSSRVKENAVSGLLNLVRCGGEVVGEEIRQVGLGLVFDGLDEVAQHGSVKGRQRAESLMKILEDGITIKRLSSDSLYSGSSSGCNSGSLVDSHSY